MSILSILKKSKDATSQQVRSHLLKQGTKYAYAMKSAKKLDHLKLLVNGQWYEVEPFYTFVKGRINDITLKVLPFKGSKVPMDLKGEFTIPEWNNLWHDKTGQYAMMKTMKKEQFKEKAYAIFYSKKKTLKAKTKKYIRRWKGKGGKWVYEYPGEKKEIRKDVVNIKDMDEKSIQLGDMVNHYKFGKGKITNIDTKTYSIPMVTFESQKLGEKITRSANEFSKNGN